MIVVSEATAAIVVFVLWVLGAILAVGVTAWVGTRPSRHFGIR